MANINTRNGILVFDFRYKGMRCRESSHLVDTPANRRHCEKALQKMNFDLAANQFQYSQYFPKSHRLSKLKDLENRHRQATSNAPLFSEFIDVWFARKQIEWRSSYTKTTRLNIDCHLLPAFGSRPVDAINRFNILDFRASLGLRPGRSKTERLSTSRINHIMTTLRTAIDDAADEYRFATPFINVKPLKIKRSDVKPFTLNEVKTIINAVRDDLRSYFIVRFFTGLRTGEIDGLKWKYIDFERKEILVREAWVDSETVQTKTDGSSREIAMSTVVYEAFKSQWAITGRSCEYVFCTKAKTPLNHNNITKRVWYPLLKLLNLSPRCPYQTRHTAATLWLAAGENPEWIAKQLGHTTTEMLFKIYSRFVPNLTRRDGSAFDQLLNNQFSESMPDILATP